MIGKLTGIILEKNPPQILLDVQGIGYEVDVPMNTFYNLPPLQQQTALYTHLIVREDAQLLYGFASVQERSAFRALLKINGIGARLALSALSSLSLAELSQAIQEKDAAVLTRIPGVGKKTAERIALELHGKFEPAATPEDSLSHPADPVTDSSSDIIHALIALGYNNKEASRACKQLPPQVSVEDGIRQALKFLSAK